MQWNLGIGDTPLIDENIQAWRYGPVIRSLYRDLKGYKGNTIPSLYHPAFEEGNFEEETEVFLNTIWQYYGKYTGPQLSTITHEDGSPWDIIWNECGGKYMRGAIIPNALIKDHYKKLIDETT